MSPCDNVQVSSKTSRQLLVAVLGRGLLLHEKIDVTQDVQGEMQLCQPLRSGTNAKQIHFALCFAAIELQKPHRIISLTAETE